MKNRSTADIIFQAVVGLLFVMFAFLCVYPFYYLLIYPHAEIHLTEWSSSPSSRDCAHDMLPEASFIIESNLAASGLVDSLSYCLSLIHI